MNTLKTWSKSFLSIYHILPVLTSSIDKLVYLKGINSSNFNLSNNFNTYHQVDVIGNLMQKKINLINLKVITDEVLLEMDEEDSKLLIFRYIDGLNATKCIELSHMPKRSYFRAFSMALNKFQNLFYLKVLSNKKIYNSFINDELFEQIFNKINLIQDKQVLENIDKNKLNNKLCSFIITKIKNAY